MNSDKTAVVTIGSERATTLVRAAFLVGTVIVSPLFLAQPITGVFVNMALVLAALSFGVGGEAILVAAIPSVIAFLRGQLPAPLFPLIPFIITGNIILVATVHFSFRKYGSFALSAALGSLIKFVFLAAVGFAFAATYFAETPLAATTLTMLGWLQLATALGGSVLAFGVSKLVRFRD